MAKIDILPVRIEAEVHPEDFLRALREGEYFIRAELEDALNEIMDDAIESANDYPEPTEGNFPPYPFYEREVGYWRRTRKGEVYMRDDQRSQQMKTQWVKDVYGYGDDTYGRIENMATYSGYVLDDPKPYGRQTDFHALHGWVPLSELVRAASTGKKVSKGGGGFTSTISAVEEQVSESVGGVLGKLQKNISNFFGRFRR